MTAKRCTCILQVEDLEADIFLLQYAFEKAGIENPVYTVRDGQMAINYLAGVGEFADREKYPPPCIVLLDLKLPKVNGFEVLEWLRRQPRLRNLVVVVFSSSALPGDLERAYELGANSYIEKPGNLDRTKEIAQLLKGWWLGYNHFPPLYGPDRPKEPGYVASAGERCR
jgi:CheY-like chemotaxis protein